MSRPEDKLPADLYYNDAVSQKYTTSSRVQHIQATMTQRALELLDLRKPSLILDVGCGSGLSGSLLSTAPRARGGPHVWVGTDVSASMLAQALARDVDGDLLLADAGQGVPFRAGSFDAAISISALQWLCCVDGADEGGGGGGGAGDGRESARKLDGSVRLARFFAGLYASLRRGGRAVCQFYPRDSVQREMICREAVRAGFSAGVLEDDPGTKNVKLYLVLRVGGDVDENGNAGGDITNVVSGMDGVDVVDARRSGRRERLVKPKKGSRQWIVRKKEQMERKGKIVKATTKYTGRKRRIAF